VGVAAGVGGGGCVGGLDWRPWSGQTETARDQREHSGEEHGTGFLVSYGRVEAIRRWI
jgi:hypothetical protein